MIKKSTGYKLFELAQSNHLNNIKEYCEHNKDLERHQRFKELKMMQYLMQIGCLRPFYHNYLELAKRDLDLLLSYDG